MRFHHVFLCAIGMLTLGVVAAKPSFAQAPLTHAGFSSPGYNENLPGGSDAICHVPFATVNHYIVFQATIHGTVTWSGSIQGYKGTNTRIYPDRFQTHMSDGGSELIDLDIGDEKIQKNMTCYGTIDYSAPLGTASFSGRGDAIVGWSIPGSTPGSVVASTVPFTIQPAPSNP